ncbi:MAG: response regulator [Pseudohongiella sp.]|nr:response regulator [Pseudohongiella sp.]
MSGIESLQATPGVASVSRLRGAHPVLVVEDSDEDFDTVLTAARLAGIQHKIRRALTGDDCLRVLRGTAGRAKAQVALVLLDLNTPHGDGRYALEKIHADPQLNAIPMVVLSTSANPRDVDFCYAHGANAYHVKPVSHSEHLLVLQTLFTYWLGSVVLPTEQSLER